MVIKIRILGETKLMATKHVGLSNAQKIVVVLHELEDEPHMSLVLYTDKMPSIYVQEVFKTLNSIEGQEAKNLADVLDGVLLPDGRRLAMVLHTEGHFKKIPNDNIFMTPDSVNKIRLSELNGYLKRIDEGGEAFKKLKEIDDNRGMKNLKKKLAKGQAIPEPQTAITEIPVYEKASVVTQDSLIAQSQKLLEAANALIAQSKELATKAAQMSEENSKKIMKKLKV